jgi:hypothetical protein
MRLLGVQPQKVVRVLRRDDVALIGTSWGEDSAWSATLGQGLGTAVK